MDETNFVNTNNPDSLRALITAYPNPFRDRVTIILKTTDTGNSGANATLEIYGIDGKLVRHFEQKIVNNEATFAWDASNDQGQSIPGGVYLAMAKSGRQTGILKLVKQ